jgi:hypothetical protein
MIAPDKRKAIYLLAQEGMKPGEIAQRLGVSRNTVLVIIDQKGEPPPTERALKVELDPELLRRLYQQCQGHIQRVYEKLVEEEKIPVKYSTLTRRLRLLGISHPASARCEQFPDEPGAEMQHDTSVYQIELGSQKVKVVASLLYLRYSKRRYLKFYPYFQRFTLQCFFHEALTFWGYVPRQCIIDNTNLARLRGTGRHAVIVPEMVAFSQQYGFAFVCHALKHPNRKAGEERGLFTVEINFLPGRTFASWTDLNQQARAWATERMEHRPQGKANVIPGKAFEHELGFLTPLPAHLPAPYQVHDRGTDQYGFMAFDANYYWVPGTERAEVRVLEYSDHLQIYQGRVCLAAYPLPAPGITNQQFSPPGQPAPRHYPRHCPQASAQEEQRLRALGEPLPAYLDLVLASPGLQRHQYVRRLFALSHQMTPELFRRSVARALKYQITSLATLERIAMLELQQGTRPGMSVELDEQFRQRPAYQDGALTDAPDLSRYELPPPSDHE